MAKHSIIIAGEIIEGGTAKSIDLKMARLYTHADLTIPVRVVCGKHPGPVLFVSGVIHGDEINGLEIIRRVLRQKVLAHLHGTLITVPVVNVFGFVLNSRYLPDRRDLNRSFPGSSTGSLASQMAARFMEEIVAKSTHGIDLHTAASHRFNLPQIRANMDDPATRELAMSFGAPVIIDSNIRDGSLRQAVMEADIPVLLYEAGEALRFNASSITAGVRGVMRVMRHLKMLPGRKTKQREPFIARSSTWVRAPQSGIFRPKVEVGNLVKNGKRLGWVADPFGEEEIPVQATAEGIVIGIQQLPLVHRGDALVHIARVKGSSGPAEPVDFSEEPESRVTEP